MITLSQQLKDYDKIKQMLYEISMIPIELKDARKEYLSQLSQELQTYKTMYKTKYDPFNKPR